MKHSTDFDVAVVGRGAVGAAAALGLAQSGLRVGWVGPAASAAPAPPVAEPAGWDSRVYALSPGTRTLLQQLRVWDALPAPRMAPVYDMRVYSGPDPAAPELHFDAYRGKVDALAWIVEDRVLMQALSQALRYTGVVAFDEPVAALEVDDGRPGGCARLTLASGAAIGARIVVGADGAASTIRELAGIVTRVHDYPQRAVVANFDATLPHGDCAYQWFGEHGVLALLPLPADTAPGRCSMVWSAPFALADELMALPDDALAQRVTDASLRTLGELTTITPARAFPLRLVQVHRLVATRVVLAGDAAHAMHPLAGQGMNVGFGDVAQLLAVWAGRESFRDIADALLWRRYERARRDAVALMQETTDGLSRAFGPLPAPLVGLRDLGWQIVARSDWIKRRLMAHAAL